MINLTTDSENTFVLYVDTIDNDVQTYDDYFLLGFQNAYAKNWAYVVPIIDTRNSRYLKLTITLVNTAGETDPLIGTLFMIQRGNWDYKLWNTAIATIDPTVGTLLDEGQMVLEKKKVS